LNDLLNRTQAVVHRSDVWAALALAKEWQRQGLAQWFRGQVFSMASAVKLTALAG
jgi:hypothetical protein